MIISIENNLFNLAKKHENLILELWASVEVDSKTVVSSSYQKLNKISYSIIQQLHRLEGSNVLDIGCNSGIYSLLGARYAKKMLGCDTKEGYIFRAQVAKQYFQNSVYDVSNTKFVVGNFVDYLNDDIDCIIASKVLYHLGDKNILALKNFLSIGKRKILIQARPQRDISFKKYPEWGVVSATKIYNGLYKLEDCLDFLRDCGFDSVEISSMTVETNGEFLPIIYAARDV